MPHEVPPVIVTDGSFRLEANEPIDLDTSPCNSRTLRQYRYALRSDRNIRYIEVKVRGRVVFKWDFKPKECQIDIYWDKPGAQPQGKAVKAAKKAAKKSAE